MAIELSLFQVERLSTGDASDSLIIFGLYNEKEVVAKVWTGEQDNLDMERNVYAQLIGKLRTPHVPTYIGSFDDKDSTTLENHLRTLLSSSYEYKRIFERWRKPGANIHMHVVTVCPGKSLDDYIRANYDHMTKEDRHSFDQEIAIQIAQALMSFHACGLTHNDLRPGNIFVHFRHQSETTSLYSSEHDGWNILKRFRPKYGITIFDFDHAGHDSNVCEHNVDVESTFLPRKWTENLGESNEFTINWDWFGFIYLYLNTLSAFGIEYVNSPLYSLLESFPKHIKDFSPSGRVGYLSFPGRPCICRESSVEPEFKEDLLESLSVEHALMLDDCYESSESCSLRLIVAMQEEDLDPPMNLIQSYFDHLFYCKKCDRLVLDVSQNMCTPQQYISSMFPNTVIHSLKRYNGRSDITISPKRQRSEAI